MLLFLFIFCGIIQGITTNVTINCSRSVVTDGGNYDDRWRSQNVLISLYYYGKNVNITFWLISNYLYLFEDCFKTRLLIFYNRALKSDLICGDNTSVFYRACHIDGGTKYSKHVQFIIRVIVYYVASCHCGDEFGF